MELVLIGLGVAILLSVVYYFMFYKPAVKATQHQAELDRNAKIARDKLMPSGYRSRPYIPTPPPMRTSGGGYYSTPSSSSVSQPINNDSSLNLLTTLMVVDTLLNADDAYDRHTRPEPVEIPYVAPEPARSYEAPSSSSSSSDDSWSSKSDDSGWNRSDSTDYGNSNNDSPSSSNNDW